MSLHYAGESPDDNLVSRCSFGVRMIKLLLLCAIGYKQVAEDADIGDYEVGGMELGGVWLGGFF